MRLRRGSAATFTLSVSIQRKEQSNETHEGTDQGKAGRARARASACRLGGWRTATPGGSTVLPPNQHASTPGGIPAPTPGGKITIIMVPCSDLYAVRTCRCKRHCCCNGVVRDGGCAGCRSGGNAGLPAIAALSVAHHGWKTFSQPERFLKYPIDCPNRNLIYYTPLASVGYSSGQRGQTVNLLAYAFQGSNPCPTTSFRTSK